MGRGDRGGREERKLWEWVELDVFEVIFLMLTS
jgi:hypothetical protein